MRIWQLLPTFKNLEGEYFSFIASFLDKNDPFHAYKENGRDRRLVQDYRYFTFTDLILKADTSKDVERWFPR